MNKLIVKNFIVFLQHLHYDNEEHRFRACLAECTNTNKDLSEASSFKIVPDLCLNQT